MYQLYYSPGACSLAVHVALLECGAKFELKNASIPEGKNKDPEFLKLNPRGSVPVLVDDGQVIREGAAQLIWLLEKEKSPLLPKDGPARAKALEWLMFANSTMHPAYSKTFWVGKMVQDAQQKDALMKACCQQIEKLWQEVDAILAKQEYICGSELTAADILLCVFANWQGWIPQPIVIGENCKRMFKKVTSRPAFQKALEQEKVEYKAAA